MYFPFYAQQQQSDLDTARGGRVALSSHGHKEAGGNVNCLPRRLRASHVRARRHGGTELRKTTRKTCPGTKKAASTRYLRPETYDLDLRIEQTGEEAWTA